MTMESAREARGGGYAGGPNRFLTSRSRACYGPTAPRRASMACRMA